MIFGGNTAFFSPSASRVARIAWVGHGGVLQEPSDAQYLFCNGLRDPWASQILQSSKIVSSYAVTIAFCHDRSSLFMKTGCSIRPKPESRFPLHDMFWTVFFPPFGRRIPVPYSSSGRPKHWRMTNPMIHVKIQPSKKDREQFKKCIRQLPLQGLPSPNSSPNKKLGLKAPADLHRLHPHEVYRDELEQMIERQRHSSTGSINLSVSMLIERAPKVESSLFVVGKEYLGKTFHFFQEPFPS